MMLHLSLYIETDNHDSSHQTSHMQCYIDKVLLYCVTAHIVHCNYLQRKEFQRRLFQKNLAALLPYTLCFTKTLNKNV